MNYCKYEKKGKCVLMESLLGNPRFVFLEWCISNCSPNNDSEKLKMLLGRSGKYGDDDIRRIEMQKEIADAVARLPSKYQMVRNLGRHTMTVVKHWKKTGKMFVTPDHRSARLNICRADDCGFYGVVEGSPRCKYKECGCHLAGDLGKTRFVALPCPVGFHDETDRRFSTQDIPVKK